ncbi:hypothetical protein HETIRDRAFT_103231 [Heterobasidion irregulare TC 32-1]|uniref:Uncharacterized protein n=1 Tax=Heterobasidion irregulare (strain TC 32-1) TaxID=747525 RepID=W4KFT6_HETIT|nr:uncharacterized protein HETIRDRAFT_103231 [Heterobasidion irregulare TC 32-1]ETW84712.1 hypothetical protein HETIRDRAFT_103231 [Heterobasidion irregulare TC 32-1]
MYTLSFVRGTYHAQTEERLGEILDLPRYLHVELPSSERQHVSIDRCSSRGRYGSIQLMIMTVIEALMIVG